MEVLHAMAGLTCLRSSARTLYIARELAEYALPKPVCKRTIAPAVIIGVIKMLVDNSREHVCYTWKRSRWKVLAAEVDFRGW